METTINDLLRIRHESSMTRFSVLSQLHHAGPDGLSTKGLAQRLIASKGNITRLIDRMETDGLVQRRPCSEDRRVSHIFMTEAGENVFHAIAGEHEDWTARIFGILDDDELETLVRLTDRIRANTLPEVALGISKSPDYANGSDHHG
ncbi:MarR family winged helix-turn-helix transcriptional regulator [Aquisalimonas sp. APHAB1-3]|uniref:MarR family winged helix-turn-helix transcriptional regulator n=1 Tax=Aquisalimonas sp. APHAB1-3 TaxID=3402080 RepID=UPI003AAAFBCA